MDNYYDCISTRNNNNSKIGNVALFSLHNCGNLVGEE